MVILLIAIMTSSIAARGVWALPYTILSDRVREGAIERRTHRVVGGCRIVCGRSLGRMRSSEH
eukprot:15932783-Heterocapsa_arctica.AAC.1